MSRNSRPAPTRRTMVRRIEAIYAQATPQEVDEGMYWYAKAHAIARSLDPDPAIGAGIIAALSPQLSWGNNVKAAKALVAGIRPTRPLPASIAKAERIHGGEAPAAVLGGKKVTAFYANILDPQDALTVTIDRHAVALATGWSPMEGTLLLGRKGGYEAVADAYRHAARRLGILPSQVQAITWCAWRRINNIWHASEDVFAR